MGSSGLRPWGTLNPTQKYTDQPTKIYRWTQNYTDENQNYTDRGPKVYRFYKFCPDSTQKKYTDGPQKYTDEAQKYTDEGTKTIPTEGG
jgi:hypothetical protein